MSKEDGGPAFPAPEAAKARFGSGNEDMFMGVTVRDYFAAKALQSVILNVSFDSWPACAKAAYDVADAMLLERAK